MYVPYYDPATVYGDTESQDAATDIVQYPVARAAVRRGVYGAAVGAAAAGAYGYYA